MNVRLGLICLATASISLAACQPKPAQTDAADTSVVATVYGQPITEAELAMERGGLPAEDATARAAADRAAVNRIVERRLLAKAADDEKLAQGAEFELASRRALENVKAALVTRKVGAATAEPKADAVASFVNDNPDMFSERKLYSLDRVLMRKPKTPFKAQREITSLDELQAALDAEKYPYQRSQTVVDSAAASASLVQRLKQFTVNQMFEVDAGDVLSVNVIREIRPAPLTGATATSTASNLIRRRLAEETLNGKIAQLKLAAKDKITYSEGYAPTAPAAQP